MTSTPCALSLATSATKACGSNTTPLPMIDSLPSRTTPGGQQRQLVDLAVDHQRVAGIVAALETHHDIGPLRQPVDDLALALVAPLRADDHHIGHSEFPSICGPRKAEAGELTGLYRHDPEGWKPVFAAADRGRPYRANRDCRCTRPNAFPLADHLLERRAQPRSGQPVRFGPAHHASPSLYPSAADDAVLGRQRDRRQAGGRPYLADAAHRGALGHRGRASCGCSAAGASPADWPAIRARLPLLIALGAFGFSIFNVALYSALNYTSAINVSIEQAGMPMLIFILNFLLFRLSALGRADRRLPALDRRRRADGQPWRAARACCCSTSISATR